MNTQLRPKLDHFMGHHVIDIDVDEPTENSTGSDWFFTFDNGAVVRNHDGRRTAMPGIYGKALVNIFYSDTETRMIFADGVDPHGNAMGQAEVVLTPTAYSITTGTSEPVFPQVPEEMSDYLPPDPSPERTADGPETHPHESQGNPTSQSAQPIEKRTAHEGDEEDITFKDHAR